ncbi:MAG: hypothetical protein ACREAA_06140 [Candidatus Polarisedimenticolia bacterium]
MKRFAFVLAIPFFLPGLALAQPVPDELPAVSLLVDGRLVDFESGSGYVAQVGAQVQFTQWLAARGSIDVNLFEGGEPGLELGMVGILPWRLEVLLAGGIVRFEDADGDTEGDPYYRGGLLVRAWELSHSAVLFGIGVQRIDPDQGDAQSDLWLSVGFRGR